MTASAVSQPRHHFDHVVQLYGSDEQSLVAGVARYLAAGITRGDGIVVIATGAHIDAFVTALTAQGTSPAAAMREGRMLCLDAATTLAGFMVDGFPDWERFCGTIDRVVRPVRARTGAAPGGLRAYGEMVGLLWSEGNHPAAICLEEFWNRFLAAHGFDLYCAYPVDATGSSENPEAFDAVLRCHTHLVTDDADTRTFRPARR